MTRTTIAICILAAAACGPQHRGPTGDDGDGDNGTVDAGPDPTGDGPPAVRCEKMDVLIVLDNSGSMGQEQTNLIANFPQFISVLEGSGLDYRVAVTTTGRNYSYAMQFPIGGTVPMSITGGHNGEMLKPAACNMTQRWISKGDPDPSGTFSCVANVGTSGPSDEMPLSAMRDAFEERMTDGTNAGFRRTDALLGVVFLTDEEDCSYEQSVTLPFSQSLCDSMQEPVDRYVQFLDTYTGHRSRWAVAAIAGPGPGRCSSTFGDADEATRLKQLVGLTGANAKMSSICDGDLSIGLMAALQVFQSACGDIIL